MFGAIQMTEFNPALTNQVVASLYKFVNLANTMLKSNNTGVEAWTATRWFVPISTLISLIKRIIEQGGFCHHSAMARLARISFQRSSRSSRLYDNHPNGTASQALLIDTMERLKWTGVPWEKVFAKQVRFYTKSE
jgi:hypothetical protein